MAAAPSPEFHVESTLNTDATSGTALRIFPKEVYAHSTPGEHELFTLMPPRERGGLRERDGFMIMMPEGSVGRIPLESRNTKANWTPPRERRNPGQIPFRDPFIQDFPVKSFGARNKRRHVAQVMGNLVRIEDLYVGIYPAETLQTGRSDWPGPEEVQAVLKRERRATRPGTLAQKAQEANLDPLDYLERNVERYLQAQGYNLQDGSAPSPLALAIAARARIDGAEEPPEGLEGLAALNDDWLDQDDYAQLRRHDPARGYIAIGTQKTWNPRAKAWEYMLTGHVAYDLMDDVGRDLVYIHPYAPEGKNRRADAAFTLHASNERHQHHLLSGHPRNPLLTPRPVMRFSFRAREWAMKPEEIPEHRPRIIAPYALNQDDALWHILVPEVRTYLREGILPADAFVAKRRSYAPPSDTRASKPRPEGLKTYRSDSGDAGIDLDPGMTLDDVVDETALDQILSGNITARPINPTPATRPDPRGPAPEPDDVPSDAEAADAPADAAGATQGEDSSPAAESGPAGEAAAPYADDDNFGALEAYLRDRETESREPDGASAPPEDHQETEKPETEQAPETPQDTPPVVLRPIIQKRIGPGGRSSYAARPAPPPPPPGPDRYAYARILAVVDALLAQRVEQMQHIGRNTADPERIRRFARDTQMTVYALLEPVDDTVEAPQAQTVRDVMNRLALAASDRPDGFAEHWTSTVQTLRDLIAPLIR